MKPVAILRFTAIEGPGYLGDFLDRQLIPWQLIMVDQGERLPDSMAGFSGLVLMGGPMSVNDGLPWISHVLRLINASVESDVPVLGHCLGGQLIAKALGAEVAANPVKEFGWGELAVSRNDVARAWFGHSTHACGFHWHGETFSLPVGVEHVLSSPYCQNQGFAIGKHLALQCHIEMTAEMVALWCADGKEEVAAALSGPATQSVEQILREVGERLPELHRLADRVYGHWITGLAR